MIGDALAGAMSSGGSYNSGSQTQGVGPWSAADYRNGSDIQSDNAYYDRMTQQALARPSSTAIWDDATDAEVMQAYMREQGIEGDMTPTGLSIDKTGFKGIYVKPDGTRVATFGPPEESIDSMLERAQSMLNDLKQPKADATAARANTQAAQARHDNWVAAQNAAGAGLETPIRETSTPIAGSGSGLTIETDFPFPAAPIEPGFARGFATGQSDSLLARPVGQPDPSAAEKAGWAMRGLASTPINWASDVFGLVREVGRQYQDVYTGIKAAAQGTTYQPTSALGNSLRKNGLLGTLGNTAYGIASAPSQPFFDALEGKWEKAGSGALGAAGFGAGAVRSVRGVSAASVGSGLTSTRPLFQQIFPN